MARKRDEGPVDRTQQQFRDECDANRIVSRYRATGAMPLPSPGAPVARYGDFSNAPDFHEAQNIVLRAQAQFDSLPVKVRDFFQYDPGRFLAFVQDPNNLDQALSLGLLSEAAMERIQASKAPPPSATPAPPAAPPKEPT